jgi:hypothetical protein
MVEKIKPLTGQPLNQWKAPYFLKKYHNICVFPNINPNLNVVKRPKNTFKLSKSLS